MSPFQLKLATARVRSMVFRRALHPAAFTDEEHLELQPQNTKLEINKPRRSSQVSLTTPFVVTLSCVITHVTDLVPAGNLLAAAMLWHELGVSGDIDAAAERALFGDSHHRRPGVVAR